MNPHCCRSMEISAFATIDYHTSVVFVILTVLSSFQFGRSYFDTTPSISLIGVVPTVQHAYGAEPM